FLANFTLSIVTRFSLQAEASHTLKGTDQSSFRYGNSSQISSSMIHNRKLNSARLISSIGIQQDWFSSSQFQGQTMVNQGNNGFVGSVKASVNLLSYQWLISLQVQRAVFQSLNKGSIQQKIVFGLNLNYLIKKKQDEKNKH
ncbi:MAG: hypothetical protein ACO29Q_05250, partial [Crocinitomicaceae bacterium]